MGMAPLRLSSTTYRAIRDGLAMGHQRRRSDPRGGLPECMALPLRSERIFFYVGYDNNLSKWAPFAQPPPHHMGVCVLKSCK